MIFDSVEKYAMRHHLRNYKTQLFTLEHNVTHSNYCDMMFEIKDRKIVIVSTASPLRVLAHVVSTANLRLQTFTLIWV